MNWQKIQKLFETKLEKTKQWFRNNLGLPTIVGIIFLLMFFLLAFFGGERDGASTYNKVLFSLVVSLFAAIASTVATFAILYGERIRNERETEGEIVRDAVAEVVTRLEAEKPYSSLRVLNREVSWRLLDVVTEIIDYSTTGGGMVLNAGPPKYLEYLDKLLMTSERSFQATVRGGETDPLYTIDWFDKDDEYEEVKRNKKRAIIYPMKKQEKIKYLRMVDEKEGISKERILIFDKNNKKEFSVFLEPQCRKNYFSQNTTVSCYLISPHELAYLLVKEKGLQEFEIGFIYEDFAIFDEQVVLKHDGKSTLFLGLKSQIYHYKSVFDLLRDRRDYFLEVNETHIGAKTWEEFAKDLKWYKNYHKNPKK